MNKFDAITVNGGIPCGKVGGEILEKIKEFRQQIFHLYGYLNDVVTESEVSVQVQ